MSSTIEDFRNFFSKKKEKQAFYLSEVIEDSVKFMNVSFINNHIHISVEIIEDREIHTFRNELLQVLITVLTNAKDVLKEIPKIDRHIYVEVEDDMIIISDNAGGINKKILSKIFEPYFTTKQSKNGTGLGLYIAKMIMQNNIGGKIYAGNTEKGAKFFIELPRV